MTLWHDLATKALAPGLRKIFSKPAGAPTLDHADGETEETQLGRGG